MKKEVTSKEYYIIYFFIYSVIGWIYEVLVYLLELKKGFVNRGFLYGTYLPIYGYGVIIIIILLNKLKEKKIKLGKINITPLIIIFLIALITGVLEYSTSYIMELIFHKRWWDYSNEPLNINGRVCLNATLRFAIGGAIILYYIHPLIKKILLKLTPHFKNKLSIIILFIIIIDTIMSFIRVLV